MLIELDKTPDSFWWRSLRDELLFAMVMHAISKECSCQL